MRALIGWKSVLYQSTDAWSNGVTLSARFWNAWTSLSVFYLFIFIFFWPRRFI